MSDNTPIKVAFVRPTTVSMDSFGSDEYYGDPNMAEQVSISMMQDTGLNKHEGGPAHNTFEHVGFHKET